MDIVVLHHNDSQSPTIDGKKIEIGTQVTVKEPARIHVDSGDTLLICAIFRRKDSRETLPSPPN